MMKKGDQSSYCHAYRGTDERVNKVNKSVIIKNKENVILELMLSF